jgi:hypothetical protein
MTAHRFLELENGHNTEKNFDASKVDRVVEVSE